MTYLHQNQEMIHPQQFFVSSPMNNGQLGLSPGKQADWGEELTPSYANET
jgi:hypothetical protein